MASKYAKLRGRIPEQPTERDEALTKQLESHQDESISDLTEAFNKLTAIEKEVGDRLKGIKTEMTAVEILIRRRIEAQNAEGITMHGYTWSEKCEPYPVCDDPTAIVQYFKDNDMADQLELKASELATRLKTFVKAESLNNELEIDTEVVDGEERTVVRSKVPGVRVFLKRDLSRVKTSKGDRS